MRFRDNMGKTLRNVLVGATILGSSLGCPPVSPPNPPVENMKPDTEISDIDVFGSLATYVIDGSDSDGSVVSFDVDFNNGGYVNYPVGNKRVSLNFVLREGVNSLRARAVDNDGAKDSTPAFDDSVFYEAPILNVAPDTEISEINVVGNMVNYIVQGSDSDGFVNSVEVNFNGEGYINHIATNGRISVDFNLQEGVNTLSARSIDDDLQRDLSPAFDDSVFYQTPVENMKPDTFIDREIREGDGVVNYFVSSIDSDGFVASIDLDINSEGFVSYTPNVNGELDFNVDLVEGENSLEARAVDNENAVDPTPAMSVFNYNFPSNMEPETDVVNVWYELGDVIYEVWGDDSDGSISSFDISLNENSFVNYPVQSMDGNGFYAQIRERIVSDINNIEARAVDNEGVNDMSVARFEFESVFFNGSNEIAIEEVLRDYQRRELLDGWNRDEIIDGIKVDWEIFRNDNSKFYMDFVSHGEDLETGLANYNTLVNNGHTILSLQRDPIYSLQEKVRAYMDEQLE